MANYYTSSSELTAICDAIRQATGVNGLLEFPSDLIAEVDAYIDARCKYDYNFPLCNVRDLRCSSIREAGFMHAKVQSVDFPACTMIGSSAFQYCFSLRTASFPNCTFLGPRAFSSCIALTDISFPKCTIVQEGAFEACYSLKSLYLPLCTDIGEGTGNICWNCSELSIVDLPNCTIMRGSHMFGSCAKLQYVNLPKCSIIASSAFSMCSALSYLSFPACTSIGICAFTGCTNLSSIYLLNSSVVSLAVYAVFEGTKITQTTGSIIVPASLVNAYKTGDWWYFSDRIFGI